MIRKLALYWRTSIHLTLTQVFFRILSIFRKRFLYRFRNLIAHWYAAKAHNKNIENINFLDFGSSEIHVQLGRTDRIKLDEPTGNFVFTFLNKSLSFENKIDWNPAGATFLWRYNLHYFDYAYDLGIAYLKKRKEKYFITFKLLIKDWIEMNPITQGIGWDPYPTSLRIVNWVKAYHFFSDRIEKDSDFRKLLLNSLYQQSLCLNDNIEYYLENNHLIENARALFIAGSFFKDSNARKWQRKGLKLLWNELKSQILEDGAQFELSPMYHAVVLLNYIDVTLVLQGLSLNVPDWVINKLKRMVQFLELMCFPDGEIAYVNDASQGMTVPTSQIFQVFSLLEYKKDAVTFNKLIPLNSSGYYIIQNFDNYSKCIFDCGVLGPDFQPGHGHCDTLSFVWAHQGQRVVVDSGVDDYYRKDDWRNYYRSTKAHNTIEIDGMEQSEIWGNFRVGRRARPIFIRYQEDSNFAFVQGAHDGYFHLPGNVIHKRTLVYLDAGILIVFDEITGKKYHKIKSFLHFHPKFETQSIKSNKIILSSNQFDVFIFPFGDFPKIENVSGQLNPIQGWYADEFGKRYKNDVLTFYIDKELPIHTGYCLIPIDKSVNKDVYSIDYYYSFSHFLLSLRKNKELYDLKFSDTIELKYKANI